MFQYNKASGFILLYYPSWRDLDSFYPVWMVDYTDTDALM